MKMNIKKKQILFLSLLLISSAHSIEVPLSQKESDDIIGIVDDRQRNGGDYKAICYVKEMEKDKEPKVLLATVYRRDKDDKFMMIFEKPKEDSGKGYLKIDKNLWNYDPGTGKWERRTERERLAGTNSRRSDFDESKLKEDYKTTYLKSEKVGEYETYLFQLQAKDETAVPYPKMKLWVDKESKNLIKREEMALSDKLLRTTYYPKWQKKYSESKKSDVYVPKEIRIYDELEKGSSTIVFIKDFDLHNLELNIFTKAWIEGKSR